MKEKCKSCLGFAWIKSSISGRYLKCPRCRGTGADFLIRFDQNLSNKEKITKKIEKTTPNKWTTGFLKRKIIMCLEHTNATKSRKLERNKMINVRNPIFFTVLSLAIFVISSIFVFNYFKQNSQKNYNSVIENKIIKKEETNQKDIINQNTFSNEYYEEDYNYDSDSDSYKIGYNQGYNAFMAQIGKSEKKLKTYTVSTGKSIIIQEDLDQGYVDGYHKAADSMTCPRNCP
jgi:hypothetical protein